MYPPRNYKSKKKYHLKSGFPYQPFGKAMTPKLLITQLQICLLLLLAVLEVVARPTNMAKPGCKDTCGNVTIPFPFGMGPNHCFLHPWFEIKCKTSPPTKNHSKGSNYKPFLSKYNIELIEVSLKSSSEYTPSVRVRIPPQHVCSADAQSQQLQSSIDLRGSPYNFSTHENVFMVKGCPGSAVLINQSNAIMAGCGTVCDSYNRAIPTDRCYGVHCCQTLLPSDQNYYSPLQFYQISFDHQSSGGRQDCLVATIIDRSSVQEYVGNLSSSDQPSFASVVLLWTLPTNFVRPHKHSHATCYRDSDFSFNDYSCYCEYNYRGNPYVDGGCQAPEGCEGCRGYCLRQLHGAGYYCENRPLLNLAAILGLSNSFGMLLLIACLYGLYRFIKRRREIKRRAKFFKRNGGFLLQKQLSSNEGVVERTKIFTKSELDKATDQFNESRILGQGGQGTVYKGMLTDGSIVAIKKSKLLDEIQLEQFINEVVILSRVNHRHVVKLFGCCLETEVPLLVYEFIPNGTLYQHIHDPDEDFSISWEMRLKIAADSASAIAYLHSSSSIPIYHRDIKSLNILLDEKHKAKVSDFGSSKTIAIDQTHLTTLVQGTMGYLDPEYFQSYQFTEKSDVYSFGVVLLELLTSKKPIYREAGSMEQKNLVTEFLFLTQNSRLSEILDPKIVIEAKEDELTSAVELAKRCICWSGKLRPTMKEVVMTLEMIMKSPAQVSTWYQQQEAFPIQYAAYDEFDMTDISGAEFMSITLPAGASSPLYTDENPLLSDTI